MSIPLPPYFCLYCGSHLCWSGWQFTCHCEGAEEAKTASALRNKERMESLGWKEKDLLKEIQEESK